MTTVTRKLYQYASFVRHLPGYMRMHRGRVASMYAKHTGNGLFINDQDVIIPPQSSSVTHAVWAQHLYFGGHTEDRIFDKVRNGCVAFLDLGSAEGYYSARFAATARRDCRIAAVDLSSEMVKLHEEVITLNLQQARMIDWKVYRVAISDRAFESTLGDFDSSLVTWYDKDPTVTLRANSLAGFLEEIDFVPDLVKIDVESHEFEIIESSIDWLAEHRPNLHLELHSEMIRARNGSPEKVLSMLQPIYNIVGTTPRNYRDAVVSRIGFMPR